MCKIYKTSWKILFKNKAIFLPAIIYTIITYILFVITLYASGLSNIEINGSIQTYIQMLKTIFVKATVVLSIFFIIDFIIAALIKSVRLSYIKQAISNKKIDPKNDLKLGIKNFKSVLLIKFIIFLLYAIIISILVTLLTIISTSLQWTNYTQNNSLELNGWIFLFFIFIAVILIALKTLNTYPALFLKNLKGKKAFIYSYKLFLNNKKEVIKTLLAIFLTSGIFASIISLIISSILNLISTSLSPLIDITNVILLIITTSWIDNYIMLKFKELKAPKS
ncbi:hypothetical protein HY498_04760 [Candidatus Woesearchaeota archaeon]|nr:hypothetical protein [Candidatus Woesearchaeota archaeon]